MKITLTISGGISISYLIIHGASTKSNTDLTCIKYKPYLFWQTGCDGGTKSTTDNSTTTLDITSLTSGCSYSFTVASILANGGSSPESVPVEHTRGLYKLNT